MARRVLMAEVSGGRVRSRVSRPRLGWTECVNVAFGFSVVWLDISSLYGYSNSSTAWGNSNSVGGRT